MNLQNKWEIDDEIAKIMNKVAEETGVKTSEIKEILASYYYNSAELMKQDSFPRIEIHGLCIIKPIPNYLKRRIKKLEREKQNEKTTSTIHQLKISLTRLEQQKQKITEQVCKHISKRNL